MVSREGHRIMICARWVCVTLVALFGLGSIGRADELEQMAPDMSQLFAMHLTELFNKENPERQAKFDVDPAQATGLRSGRDGIVAVPIKGLKEGEVDPAVESENGAGLCYLFLSPCFAPFVDGKPVDTSKLRSVKFDDGQGGKREAICLIVTVKHVDGDDWRMYCFGADKKPVLNSQFGGSSQSADKTLAIRVNGGKDMKANLEFTLHKKYSAAISIATK
jgi:hypothetical protein